jgi:hypothetical protein
MQPQIHLDHYQFQLLGRRLPGNGQPLKKVDLFVIVDVVRPIDM